MPKTTARLDSDRPQRYLKQIVSHLGNRVETGLLDADHASIRVPGGGSCQLTADSNTIVLQATAADAEALAHIQDVVARHLLRFTHSAHLTVDWAEAVDE